MANWQWQLAETARREVCVWGENLLLTSSVTESMFRAVGWAHPNPKFIGLDTRIFLFLLFASLLPVPKYREFCPFVSTTLTRSSVVLEADERRRKTPGEVRREKRRADPAEWRPPRSSSVRPENDRASAEEGDGRSSATAETAEWTSTSRHRRGDPIIGKPDCRNHSRRQESTMAQTFFHQGNMEFTRRPR